MKNTILKLDGEYTSKRESIIRLIKDIEKQLFRFRPGDIRENSEIDLSKLRYIDSNVSVILFAFLRLIGNSTPVDIIIKMPNRESLQKLLAKNNFSSLWNETAEKDYCGTIIKITENKNVKEATNELKKSVNPILEKVFSKDYKNEFISSLAEACCNAFQHGNAETLFICGQFYPNQHKLCLTLLNFGNTFRDNFIRFAKENNLIINDTKIISWALEENNSTDENSPGIGLSRFMEVVKKCDADLIIISGDEVYTYENGQEYDVIEKELFIKGTIINIVFNLNSDNFL